MLDHTQSLDRFLASIEGRAYRIAELATGNRDDALELVQEAMLGLVRRYARRPAEEWKPLFYRILENGIRDWHRRRTLRGRWLGWLDRTGGEEDGDGPDPLAQVPDPNSPDPARILERQMTAESIDRALRTLPLRQQQAFLLRAWEGLDTAQTAAAMGCSEGSVKTHYSRATHALRQQLEETQT